MSSAALTRSTARYVGPKSATVWRHILWKDFRQVWQLLVGIAVVQISLQLLMGGLEMAFPNDMRGLSQGAINIALAAPTLLAIACSGVLIGQERQNGCWTWNSCLPLSWRASLVSKAVVWFFSSGLLVSLLLGGAAVALGINGKSLGEVLLAEQQGGAWTYLMTPVIAVQVFLYFSIAALLIKDTLLALVSAALGLFVFHCFVVLFNITAITGALNGRGYPANHETWVILAYLASFILGVAALAATYRWRWGSGQYASLQTLGGRSSKHSLRPQRAAWQAYAASAGQPSEWQMLWHHGYRSSLGLRGTVFCGALLAIFLSFWLGGPSAEPVAPLAPLAACLASCFLGVSVFSGDQTLGRYRFFADRGVTWRNFMVSHIAPPALLSAACALAAIMLSVDARGNIFYLLCIPIFVVGMFSSLAFASPIIALTVASAMLFSAFAISGAAMNIWLLIAPGYSFAFAMWWPVSTLLVLGAAVWLVPRWLLRDRLNSVGMYFGAMLVAGLLPCVFGLSLGFLQIPKVAWLGTPLEHIPQLEWSDGPAALPSPLVGMHTERSEMLRALHWPSALSLSKLSSLILEEIQASGIDARLADQSTELVQAIERHGSKPDLDGFRIVGALNSMLEGSAVVALLATAQRDKTQAIRAWKANRKLIAFCQQPALQAATMRSVAFVWEIWNTLDDDDLKFLLDTQELADLTPGPRPTRQQFSQSLRARATLHRFTSSSMQFVEPNLKAYLTYVSSFRGTSGLRVYPPIRWAYERQEALALNHDLAAIGDSQVQKFALEPNIPIWLYDPAVRDYNLLGFLEERFQERLRVILNPAESEGAKSDAEAAESSAGDLLNEQ